jgi:hypothetical protein
LATSINHLETASVPETCWRGKLAYVEVMKLLDIPDLAVPIVGVGAPGGGLDVRYWLTIGVKLMAKPDLSFLDEPTGGLYVFFPSFTLFVLPFDMLDNRGS